MQKQPFCISCDRKCGGCNVQEGEINKTMKRKVIIDCDPGIDDSLALMLALSMEEICVEGVTVVCGNCPVDMGVANAGKVLAFMGRLDIPVFSGACRPLRRKYADALDTHGRDGLGESFLPEAEGCRQDMDAAAFLAETLEREPCSIIALGPMTNLAMLLEKNPGAFGRIEEIVSMGGNFKSRGNCSPVAEYNYWADPDSASKVYEAMGKLGKRVHMVGLDVTRKVVLTPDLLEYLKRLTPETGAFVEKITKFYFDFHWRQEHLIGCVINDPLAVAYFADRSLCRGFEAYTQVETEGICVGQTVVDYTGGGTGSLAGVNFYKKAANSVILTQVDVQAFFRMFFGRISGRDEESLDLLPGLIREGEV